MPDMAQAVARHNTKILQGDQKQPVQPPSCYCQGGLAGCPVQGKCKTVGVIYRATVTETGTGKVEIYILEQQETHLRRGWEATIVT